MHPCSEYPAFEFCDVYNWTMMLCCKKTMNTRQINILDSGAFGYCKDKSLSSLYMFTREDTGYHIEWQNNDKHELLYYRLVMIILFLYFYLAIYLVNCICEDDNIIVVFGVTAIVAYRSTLPDIVTHCFILSQVVWYCPLCASFPQ